MKDAVKFLSSEDEEYQYCGASFIQHNTYNNDKAKEEVVHLVFNVTTLLLQPEKDLYAIDKLVLHMYFTTKKNIYDLSCVKKDSQISYFFYSKLKTQQLD